MAAIDDIMQYLNGMQRLPHDPSLFTPMAKPTYGNPTYANIGVDFGTNGKFGGGPGDTPDSNRGPGRGGGDDYTNPWRARVARERALQAGYAGLGSAGDELANAGIPIEIGQHLIRVARRGHLEDLLGRINAGNVPGWLPKEYITGELDPTGQFTVPGTRGFNRGIEGALGYLGDRYGQLRDLRQVRNDARGGDVEEFLKAREAFQQYRQQLRKAERRGVQLGRAR